MKREEITATLVHNMHETIDGTNSIELDFSKSMKDYGADSLEMVEVVSKTMKQLKIKIPRTELTKVKNIEELITLFEQNS